MGKIHVVTRKEEIDEVKMDNKIAVVFDVLLATSTIATVLHHGAVSVIPVLDGDQARKRAAGISTDEYILVGEYEGRTIEGFLDPNPSVLKDTAAGKKVILSTTNGTIAVHKSSPAKKVYACSLLNSKAVADVLTAAHEDETIIIVCSGSSGQFSLEDFYGAGYLIHQLTAQEGWNLSDSALTAKLFYEGSSHEQALVLGQSRVGKMLEEYGFREEITFISNQDCFHTVPVLIGDELVDFHRIKVSSN
ncbi:2-phosphosulfolactate phosphatase [Bacillus idriensis]|uniref:Probable 2-phosphosulfolactate phosphatase n=1 Tax=Metabacillus idriensis TaxID=324768 RepID=A0A6I2M5M0_9BACI|nr:2-phosphosulfolactate phosphatase [Metabacillus idriensis]MRX53485.1 2-phosphosulfolactate phosphatase [Metabacillus idriensis]